ncbi:MAG TPA: NAD(P)-dependent oxidoreductase [Bacteroidales bacterium]|nr:NAD(P)-dependent oxidoreductase [Bacteroidales bacterium]
MKILITGASGFIGGYLVEEALNRGWDVWAGVRKSSNKAHLTHPDLNFIELNYSNPEVLKQQLQSHQAHYGAWDYIIHNAGITKSVVKSDYARVNHLYTVHFVNALIKSDCKPLKFLFMSSMGAVGPGNEQTGEPLNEFDEPNPISEYGKSKWLAEKYIQSISDFPYLILRPTGVYGPREQDYLVMFKMINMGLNLAIGFNQQFLNFIYIKDLVRICFLALESPLNRKVWFVADGDYYTTNSFVEIIQEKLQKKRLFTLRIPLFIVRAISTISGALGQVTGKPAVLNPDKYQVMKQRNWTCDASQMEQDLNYKAEYNLRKGLEETINWYRNNGWI